MPISLSDAELRIVMDAAAPFSERSLYMAKAVARLRPDLAQQVRKGEMSINKAYVLATGKTKPTSWDRLVRTWNAATDDDRDRFVALLMSQNQS